MLKWQGSKETICLDSWQPKSSWLPLKTDLFSGGASLPVHAWSYYHQDNPAIHVETVVTADCIPVSDVTLRAFDQQGTVYATLMTSYYFNMQTSISDPIVFQSARLLSDTGAQGS